MLAFAPEGDGLLSTAPLPAGLDLPTILRIRPQPQAPVVNVRFQLNLQSCPDCDRPAYACVCEH